MKCFQQKWKGSNLNAWLGSTYLLSYPLRYNNSRGTIKLVYFSGCNSAFTSYANLNDSYINVFLDKHIECQYGQEFKVSWFVILIPYYFVIDFPEMFGKLFLS